MSKSRLVSGRIKKVTGAELSTDRYEYLDLANAEPDLGLPAVDESVLIGDINGTRTWVDIATYADEFKGFTGSQGDVGFVGSQGDQGFTGSSGTDGIVGSDGAQGDVGFTGSQGDVGYTGSQGPAGVGGNDGASGDVGYTGSQGELGYTGSQGFTGSKGAVVATISATPPAGPALGDVWIDSATGIQYFYVDDGDSAQWVEFSNPGTVGPSGTGGGVGGLSASQIYGLSTVFSFGG